MAKRRPTEAERLRRHNKELQFALAHNITVLEARRRLAQLEFADFERRVNAPLRPAIDVDRAGVALTYGGPPQPHYWWQER